MADIYQAQLDGFTLDIETIDDQFDLSIVRHEFPHIDGALLENMGQKARAIRFRCYFWDNTYDQHINLINYLANRDLFEFTHPQYGIITGMVEQVICGHDDREEAVTVDINFVENIRSSTVGVPAEDITASVEGDFISAQQQQMDALINDMYGLGVDVSTALDESQTLYAQLQSGSAFARQVVKELDACIAATSVWAADITQPVNSLVASISYLTTAPGRMLSVATRAAERVARLSDAVLFAPSRALSNMDYNLSSLVNVIADTGSQPSRAITAARSLFVRHLRLAAAQRLALEAAVLYAADEANRQAVRTAETITGWDVSGIYHQVDNTVLVMNVTELEKSLALVRSRLQTALSEARQITALNSMARNLLHHVTTVKLERERIITVSIDNPMPLHLVCLHHGVSYRTAQRVMSINPAVANPSHCPRSVALYA